ncbi:unnamed protein product [Lactuca saligna]|uniref:BHLH domain-containing protein n=1 Tax=Lactuca saligna TaxID=75948 RepID=A0AA35VHP7_LACSI|nr:unnamed protein product [Lactuca saligna]
MEKGFESWFQSQQINPNLSSDPGFRHRLNIPSLGNMLSPYGNPPEFAIPAGKPEQLPEPVQKKFLVFDQSNDRTTLIYSSIPIPYHLPEPQFTFEMKNEDSVMEKHKDTRSSDSFHEDTEELKALLYSDDDGIDDSEDEDEQSTGHSPVMGFGSHEWLEEVASSIDCRKRRKLDSGEYDAVSLEDTASSGVNCSGEAELSSCGNNGGNGAADAESGGKRLRKEKVRETISVLQNLIPGGGRNGKDAMVILDEAINYLRILKVKAKALGLDSL